MIVVQGVGDRCAQFLSGLVGAAFSILSVAGLAVAALASATLGMLAFALSPIRMLLDRMKGL